MPRPVPINNSLREVVWVILDHFRTAVFFCCCRRGHVGNALALSIMSTAMPGTMRAQRWSGNEAIARRGGANDCRRVGGQKLVARFSQIEQGGVWLSAFLPV
jgi:hypothetical protein